MLGSDFVSGAVTFLDKWGNNDRIVIPLIFSGKLIMAIIDTGAPYCILAPDIANELGIDLTAGERLKTPMSTRLGRYDGWLCRVPVTIESELGAGIEFETTVFVPEEGWPPDANFIGLANFLFKIHFAVDPQENLFYFSEPI
jgi:hypothetical protein